MHERVSAVKEEQRGQAPARSLDMSAQYVKGVGDRMAAVLGKMDIFTVRDIIYHFPHRHEDWSNFVRIGELRDGMTATIRGSVVGADARAARGGGLVITKVVVQDSSGTCTLVFFGNRFLRDKFMKLRGREVVAFGTAQSSGWGIDIRSPEWEEFKPGDKNKGLVPVYPLTEGIMQDRMRKIAANALATHLKLIEDTLPAGLRAQHRLMEIREAIRTVHFPDSEEAYTEGRRRLVFEELFLIQLALAMRKRKYDKPGCGIAFEIRPEFRKELLSALPFDLTKAQEKVLGEIEADMTRPQCMNRLLQGDVGSGKTAVAMAAVLIAVRNGYQAAIMAPTEILAEQHYLGLSETLGRLGISVDLLIGSLSAAEKRAAQERVANGATKLAIGTHALLQEGVDFPRLGLVIIDEQHRFGVMQRATLGEKGANPDILVMTATPIPRTMALTVYGDLDISIIDELPPGRRPIRTHWKGTDERAKVYQAARKLVQEGRQVYVVCPLIEESEKLQVRAATDLYGHLAKEVFPDLRVGLLHGQMKAADKDDVMGKFRAGELDILVATTVIEVGVDVPNATVMIIEDAERFGLAQLHQLRGRVGRADHQCYCILIAECNTEEARQRLTVMSQTSDGFLIAEEDLKLRGPGEFYGTRQSGMPALKIADIFRDVPVLEESRKAAFTLIDADPELKDPEHLMLRRTLKEKFEDLQLAAVS